MSEQKMLTNGSANEEEEDLDHDPKPYCEQDMQCGLGACRPTWLQPFANIKFFTVTLSLWSLFGSINFSYYTSVITQIERQFGLSSSVMGFIKNVDNIGYVCTVLIFSHFCRYANKPKLFAIATIFSSGAIFIFALPHFIYGTGKIDDGYYNKTLNKSSETQTEFCNGVTDGDLEKERFCFSYGSMRAFNSGAFAIFFVSEFLQGLAQSPKFTLSLTYMDDNAKDNSPRYFSFMFAMRAFSPVIGFMLGAWTTTLYVDLTETDIGEKDPRWIGAWWLGFIICSACSVVWALPMVLFPPVLRGEKNDVIDTNKGEDLAQKAKDLPLTLMRLAKTPVYAVMVLALCFEVYLMGFFTFLPKYLQQHFGITASKASIMTGVIGALSYGLGPIVSGQIVTKKKTFTPFYAMKVIVICTALASVGYCGMMFMACPNERWAGNMDRDNPDLWLPCNNNCSCDSNTFLPICGDDGEGGTINYYSPCQAGCAEQTLVNGTKYYTGCQCIPGGMAKEGMCPRNCATLYPYLLLLFVTKFVSSMDKIPTMAMLMKCVHPKDKAMALATVIAVLQVMSFPAPIVFGLVIDSSCLVLQQSCAGGGRKGACLFYDNEDFRWKLHGFTFAIKTVATVIYIVGMYLSKKVKYYESEEKGSNLRAISRESEEKGNNLRAISRESEDTNNKETNRVSTC